MTVKAKVGKMGYDKITQHKYDMNFSYRVDKY